MVDGNNKREVIEYEECPICGSKEGYIGTLAAEEEEKGISPSNVPHYLQEMPFAMRAQNASLVIGTKVPAGIVRIDFCKGCGVLRVFRCEKGEAVALPTPAGNMPRPPGAGPFNIGS